MAAPKVLVITGNGFNCEKETAYAFEMNGGKPEIYNMNFVVERDISLSDYQIMAFIGGFSYGDHLGGGRVAANKFLYNLKDDLQTFINRDTLIIGICNGFQVLMQLGVLPACDDKYFEKTLTLSPNNSRRYEDRWVRLGVNTNSKCVFTKNIESFSVPVRHGEGKIYTPDVTLFENILENNQVVVQFLHPESGNPTEEYPFNPNGSYKGIAGICDPSGRIFGLMPHPEAYLSQFNNPVWTRLKSEGKMPTEGEGVQIFRNAVEYFQ